MTPSQTRYPPTWSLKPDVQLQRRKNGRLLMGGTPFRFLRMSTAGARMVDSWFCGAAIGNDTAAQTLARRLLNSGMAHPVLPDVSLDEAPAASSSERTETVRAQVTVVIPVKDDPDGLDTTLEALGDLPIVIVDDGSSPALEAALLSKHSTAERTSSYVVVRNDLSCGPAAARNRGIECVDTPFVALVDAGVSVTGPQLEELCRHFQDDEVVAAAPRIASSDIRSASLLALYEAQHSPLDLGSQPGKVQAGSPISYVPTACLAARTSALRSLGDPKQPFDAAMRFGEDVDLEWRLAQIGSIRYTPDVVATHPPRASLRLFVQQRVGYGSSAAPLAKRHGASVAPVRTTRWSIGVVALALAGRYWLAGLLVLYSTRSLQKKLGDALPDTAVEATRLSLIGHGWALRNVVETSVRAWWPLTLIALFVPGIRGVAQRSVLLGVVAKFNSHGSAGPIKTRIVQVALGHLDDLSYGSGVWKGLIRERSVRALLPDIS